MSVFSTSQGFCKALLLIHKEEFLLKKETPPLKSSEQHRRDHLFESTHLSTHSFQPFCEPWIKVADIEHHQIHLQHFSITCAWVYRLLPYQ